VKGAATVEGDERLRLFLALQLDRDVEAALGSWVDSHLAGPGLRRVDGFHVTLAFLGTRPASELPAIVGALRESVSECGPFTLAPVRYRETRAVGMLVLDDPSGEATRLAERLQGRLEALGVYERERRPWLPHVTVVRFRDRPRLAPPLPDLAPFAPSGAAAFLSRLRRTGARYEALESHPLAT
jgi:RNA 2',3'-cyclic 3'-phosphodiesterase